MLYGKTVSEDGGSEGVKRVGQRSEGRGIGQIGQRIRKMINTRILEPGLYENDGDRDEQTPCEHEHNTVEYRVCARKEKTVYAEKENGERKRGEVQRKVILHLKEVMTASDHGDADKKGNGVRDQNERQSAEPAHKNELFPGNGERVPKIDAPPFHAEGKLHCGDEITQQTKDGGGDKDEVVHGAFPVEVETDEFCRQRAHRKHGGGDCGKDAKRHQDAFPFVSDGLFHELPPSGTFSSVCPRCVFRRKNSSKSKGSSSMKMGDSFCNSSRARSPSP